MEVTSQHGVLSEASARPLRRSVQAGVVILSTALVAVAAHLSLPLPFTPVPLVLSDFAVLAVGLLLGPALGFATLLLYLVEGAVGLPVFSPHGPGGVAQLLGPTGGYLLAYPFAAAVAGWVARRLPTSFTFGRGLLGAVLGSALLLTSGAAWLGGLMHLSGGVAWHLAIAPFLPGTLLKVGAAALLYCANGLRQRDRS